MPKDVALGSVGLSWPSPACVPAFFYPFSVQQEVHPARRFALEARHDVRVGVHRQADLGMVQDLHDDSRPDVPRQEQRRARVPQVVEPPATQTRSLEQSLEALRHVRAVGAVPIGVVKTSPVSSQRSPASSRSLS